MKGTGILVWHVLVLLVVPILIFLFLSSGGGGDLGVAAGPLVSLGQWSEGYSTRYTGCSRPYCDRNGGDNGQCSSMNKGAFFNSDGKLYGTAAVSQGLLGCGNCFEVEILDKCAPMGCNLQANSPNVGSTAVVMATNLCPECKTGHFDLCQDGNWGGTSWKGLDNPAIKYRKVECPEPLLSQMGCSG